jgi:hypothetical protein
MKNYKVKSKKDSKGLLRVSLVKDPAIETDFMFFDAEKQEVLKFVNEEKREIYAPVLIPNKLIFRKDINGEPANIFFDAETIKELHLQGCRNGYDSKINLNHEEMNVDGVLCFESWIVENPKNDKANEMGFDLPKGTLMKSYKIENEDVWVQTKDKQLTGASIEVLTSDLEFTETNNNKIEMKKDKKSVLDYIKSIFNTELAKEYGNGMFGESLEEGAIVTDKDGNPAVDAEFEFEGKKYKTDSMGAISGIEEMGEMKPKEEEEEVKKEEAPTEDVELLKSKIAELETENADLKAEISKSKESVEKMQSEIIEAKKIVPVVKEKSYEEMTNFERLKFNRGIL